MDHAHSTPSHGDSAKPLTRVSRVSRERGEVLCDHCGRTAPRAEMALDPDVESESGYVCAEGHGCAGPVPSRVQIAGRDITPAELLSPDAAARVSAVVEADLIAGGCPVEIGRLTTRERKALLRELRRRADRAWDGLREAMRGQCGADVRAQLREHQSSSHLPLRMRGMAKRKQTHVML